MKHVLTGFICLVIGAGLMLAVLWPVGEESECRKIVAEYDKTQELYELKLAQQDDILLYGLARVATSQEQREGFRRMVAIAQAKAKKAETIEQLAARLAPVEKAIKQQATDNHEFIPAAFRSYWGQVLASGLMRGK